MLSQTDLIAHREHCSADGRLLGSMGAPLGQQTRIRRMASEYALYTVSECRDEDDADVVRLGLMGRRRLGTDDEFAAAVVLPAANPTLSEHGAEVSGDLVERLDDDGEQRRLIVIAPHGDDIERHTDEQAERVASRLRRYAVSSWAVQGLEEAPRRLRRRSVRVLAHDVHGHRLIELSRTRLGHRPGFAHAVAFHGFDESEILIGGTALVALKQEIKSAIEIATSGSDLPVRVFNGTCRWRSSTPRVDFVPAGGAVSLRGAILCHQRGRSQVRFGVGGMASDKRPDCAL